MSAPTIRCDRCNGAGDLLVQRMYAPEEGPQYGNCPDCRGEGAIDIDEFECAECDAIARLAHMGKPFCSEACVVKWRRSWGYEEEEGVA